MTLVVIFLAAVSCGKRTDEGPIRIGYPPLVANAPLYVAIEDQIFDAEGVAVEPIRFPSSNDSIEALMRGDIDIAVAPPFNLIFAASSRAPGRLRILTVNDETDADGARFYFESIIVPKLSPIRALADLKGRRIGCFPGSFATGMLRAVLATVGIAADSFAVVPMDASLHLEALASGQIDALLAYEPTATVALRSGKNRLLEAAPFPRRLIDPFPNSAITMNRDFARRRPREAAAAAAALLEAIDRLSRNPDSYAVATAKWTGVSADIIVGIPQQRFRRASPALAEDLRRIAALHQKWGVIESPPDIEALLAP